MISPAANASAYPAVIHWIAETEASMSCLMLGMAMLTIVTSTRSMKAAVITMARANQRRRSAGPGWGGAVLGAVFGAGSGSAAEEDMRRS